MPNRVSRSSAIAAAMFLVILPRAGLAGGEAAGFASPPSDARILKIIHNWPDEPPAQDALIAQLSRQGFGGVVCNVSFQDYLQREAKWKSFERAVDAAKKAGWTLWLYDERGYPSGNAGGLVLRDHPEWEAQGLLIADASTTGRAVNLAIPPGTLVMAAAFPCTDGVIRHADRVDLKAKVRGGQLSWSPPPGRWHLLAITRHRLYEGTHAEGNLAEKMPYINLLMPEPTRRFLELTHEQYARRLGPDLRRDFVSTFTDEPSLMSCFLRPMPYRVLPWAPDLAAQFRKRRGYDLETILPDLVLDAGGAGHRHRHDFWLTVGELVSENYFGQIQSWCREHGLLSGGHLLMEESLGSHVALYGDFLRCARRLDAPSIDCLTSLPPEVPWSIARLMSSAAELEGNSIVMCETSDHSQRYRPTGDKRPVRTVSEAEIRGTCHRLIAGGVNCITSYFSFDGVSDDAIRRLSEDVGRCCMTLRGGEQAADIALVYPIESAWCKFVPSRQTTLDAHEAALVESSYQNSMESLFRSRREFTIVDSRALRESRIQGDSLAHGRARWRIVVLPAVDTMPLEAWEKLGAFVREGGIAVAMGSLPRNSTTEFPSPRVEAIAREIFGAGPDRPRATGNLRGGGGIYLPSGTEHLLPTAIAGVLEPEFELDGPDAPIRSTHRRIDGRDVYFLINDSARAWSGSVTLPECVEGEQLDPASGRGIPVTSTQRIGISIAAYGSSFLRLSKVARTARRRLTSGELPNLIVESIALEPPVTAQGDFVRANLSSEPYGPDTEGRRYRAEATLTRGKVDTFLFVRFHARSAPNLSADDCLVIDSWVPEGQTTGSRLLAIVHEQGGGDFLAATSRALGASGHHRSFVPLGQLQLAGWSKDADGVLDVRKLSDVSVGWGGYLGTEGERVVFALLPPRIGGTGPPRSQH